VVVLWYQRRKPDADKALWKGLAASGCALMGPLAFDPGFLMNAFASISIKI
jgi:hypothetical protein